MRKRILVIVVLLLLVGLGLYVLLVNRPYQAENSPTLETRAYADRVGTVYRNISGGDRNISAIIRQLQLPLFPGANAIWGASGRDDQGHIWFGVSVEGEKAAHLIEYIPEHARFVDHGDPVSALKANGLFQEGTTQVKIHSKIVQGDDGYLYFSSMDEAGESAQTGSLPRWGSNLWRYAPKESRWEHLIHVPEGLIAVSGMGRWIYALGYWDHVLYQYNTQTGQVRHIRVGSEGGHVSRNIITDIHGHVYVPRIKYFDLSGTVGDSEKETDRLLVTELIEYDQNLDRVGSTPLIHYAGKGRPDRYSG